ncbi:hypothetical protein [Paraburkholderia heleia]|uniref:hypothetical protein n=1 Tax=Paraburkholderia heleia TaxID=634127 RepID=UPI002AB79671|nr:hypothetical protein [Paraburkholderia heleia]
MSPYSLVDVSSLHDGSYAHTHARRNDERQATRIERHAGMLLLIGTTFGFALFAVVMISALRMLFD